MAGESKALRGMWWWIERWRSSSAFMDLSLECQAAYRNLLEEAWLRGGLLPDDERILAKACGDATRWAEVRERVMAHFDKAPGGWRNSTLDEVLEESRRRADKQHRYRQRRVATGVTDNVTDEVTVTLPVTLRSLNETVDQKQENATQISNGCADGPRDHPRDPPRYRNVTGNVTGSTSTDTDTTERTEGNSRLVVSTGAGRQRPRSFEERRRSFRFQCLQAFHDSFDPQHKTTQADVDQCDAWFGANVPIAVVIEAIRDARASDRFDDGSQAAQQPRTLAYFARAVQESMARVGRALAPAIASGRVSGEQLAQALAEALPSMPSTELTEAEREAKVRKLTAQIKEISELP